MSLLILRGHKQKKHSALKQNFVGQERGLMTSLFAHFDSDLNSVDTLFAIPYPQGHRLGVKEIEAHHKALMAKLEASNAHKVLILGADALQIVRGSKYQDVYRVRGQSWLQKIGNKEIYFVVCLDPEEVVDDPTLFPDLLTCIEKFFTQDAPTPAPKLVMWRTDTQEELVEALYTAFKLATEDFGNNDVVIVDTETTGLDPLTDKLITLGLCVKDTAKNEYLSIIIPKDIIYDNNVIQTLINFFLGDLTFVFHNAKFDVKWLQTYMDLSFFDMSIHIEDTMLMNYVLDERTTRRAGGIHGLKTLARIKFDADDYGINFNVFLKQTEEQRDYPALYEYLSKDLVYSYMLFEDLKPRLEKENAFGSGSFYRDILLPATKALAEVELEGVMIDVLYLQTLGKTYAAEIEKIKTEIQEYVFSQVEGKIELYSIIDKFNPGSPAQILKILHTIFGMDKVVDSTDRETLQTIVQTFESHPAVHFCEMILDYREYTKILSTYVTKLISSADEKGRVHGNFNLNGTSTGRLSSDNPNLQNIPRGLGAAIRKAFIVPNNFTFVNADYSQLEIRVAATLSGDDTLINAYNAGRDIHKETASKVFHIPYDEVTSEQRTITKRLVFGILYGISAYGMVHTLAEEGINATEAEAKEYIDNFLEAFPGYTKWRKKIENQFIADQRVNSVFGRMRRWPYLNTSNQFSALREAINMPIQSTASDLCLSALIRLHKILKCIGGKIIFSVHDSLVFEIPTLNLEEAVNVIRREMESVPLENAPIPFTVDIKHGSRWEVWND